MKHAECLNAQLCEILGMCVEGRISDIWQGEVLTPEECEDYRQQWARDAGVDLEEIRHLGAPPFNQTACIHRGPVARIAACAACGKKYKPVEVYYCRVYGECLKQREQIYRENSITARQLEIEDCRNCDLREPPPATPRPITLRVGWAPGDNVVATVAAYELQKQYPGRFAVTIRTHYPQIWDNTPHIVGTEEAQNGDDGNQRWYNLDCEFLLNQSAHRPRHYIEAMLWDLRRRLGLPSLEVTEFRGHVYLSDEDKRRNQVDEETGNSVRPWWIINAGGKLDCTCKLWPPKYWQAIVDRFRGRIRFVQIGARETDSGGHVHPPLRGVIDLRGKTDHAQLRSLVYHCDGIVCGNTYLMHLAAAVDNPPWRPWLRPCVVIGGGREPVNWFHYPGHQVLHTIGGLDCCRLGGCWKWRVEAIGDGRPYENAGALCSQPQNGFAACMRQIKPRDVIRRIETYLADE